MNSNTILNYPWFPKTKPAYSGGAKSGEWQGQDQAFLGRIANDLVYERANSRINSLPSPWSRALQFEQAILNQKYPTRPDLLVELFGCLATVGLWEIVGITLEAERVDLNQLSKRDDDAVGSFARALNGQRPPADRAIYELQDGSNPWDSIYVLKADGLVIGFTSPTTLVCPTVRLAGPIQGMRWTAERRFTSPKEYLSTQQRQALADWLAYVAKGLLDAEDLKNRKTVSALSDVLNGFINELTAGRIGNHVLAKTNAAGLPPRPKALSLLARSAGMEAAASKSLATVELGDRARRPLSGARNKPVVLVDSEMPGKLGISANEITLFGAATLEAVGSSKERLEQLYGREIEVITPDDLFASELYVLPGEAALTNSWLLNRLDGQPLVTGSPVTPILPLRERVRDLFSSRELEKACSLRVKTSASGQELELTLNLKIIGQRDHYPLTKSYPIKEENLLDDDLPVITIWPNVSEERWNRYYIFCEDTRNGLGVDGFTDYQLKTAQEGTQSVKYFTSRQFPDLIKLTENNRQCGLIPVNMPTSYAGAAERWSVGIDFGTSFTNFFINDGSGAKRRPLETRLLPLTAAQKEYQLNLLTRFFIPEEVLPMGENPPTSTALNTYGWQLQDLVVPETLNQARILWPSSNANAMRGQKIHTGFKWKDRQFQGPFLREIALMISSNAAASGATQIQWSVSYPSAFSRNEARGYKKCWADLCEDLKKDTGIDHDFLDEDGEGSLQTEAVAFASYFGNHLDRQLVHTACLDVGGGTTDLSIWQENKLLHQVSVKFAGQDICTRVMQLKPSFIRLLFSNGTAGEIGNDEAKLRNDPNFNSWFDNCLRYESESLLKDRLPILRSQEEKQLIDFISLMAISVGGIYHYLGLVLKGLDKEKLLLKQAPMSVYMGGNGARFMHWLDESSSFSKGSDTDELMGEIQIRSTGFTDNAGGIASTTLSSQFKDETACGLVSKGTNLSGIFDPRDDLMFAGESLSVNGVSFGVLDRVVEPEDGKVVSYAIPNTDELKRFIANYDKAIRSLRLTSFLPISRLTEKPEAVLWSEIETEIRSSCLERENEEFNDLEPEPPFFTGLKALITILSREWSERY